MHDSRQHAKLARERKCTNRHRRTYTNTHTHTHLDILYLSCPVHDVAQDLCGHDDYVCLCVKAGVAGLQAAALVSKPCAHLQQLLIAQCLRSLLHVGVMCERKSVCVIFNGARASVNARARTSQLVAWSV